MRRPPSPLLALFVSVALLPRCADAVEPVVLHGRTMGTTYNVKYWTGDADAPAPPAIQRAIDDLLSRIDEQMSTWRTDSELSRFNAAPANEWFPVSPDTVAVVARAVELHRLTDGASDATIGPVLRLWGFGPGADKQRKEWPAPNDDALRQARERVAADRLRLRDNPPGLLKEIDGLEVDLSSLAAGYAIDRIVDLLADAHIANAMVELGGEVRGVGRRPDGQPWRIGVQGPPPHEKSVAQVVPLDNLALATSGDFHNFHAVDGVRYAHIIDPRTGRPIPYRGASVTVIADTCFAADGVPTALFVMGPSVAYGWCVDHGVAALFLEPAADGKLAIRRTPRFDELIGPAP